MNAKKFLLLVLALAVLGGLAILQNRKSAAPKRTEAAEPLLDPSKLNDIARFTVASGTQSVTLARSHDRWVIEELWKYPADFAKVADRLRQLSTVEPGEVVRGGVDRLAEFGLTTTATNEHGEHGTTLVLQDAAGKTLRTVGLGFARAPKSMTPFDRMPGTAYARVDDGPVQLVAGSFMDWSASPGGWIDLKIVQVPLTNVVEVSVTPTNGPAYSIRLDTHGTYVLDGLSGNEATRPETARGLAGSLQGLWAVGVENPALDDTVTGLDKPDVHRTRTDGGIIYTLKTGLRTPSYTRYMRIGVTYEKPEPPAAHAAQEAVSLTNESGEVISAALPDPMKLYKEQVVANEKAAAEMDALLSPWIFTLAESDAQTLMMPRDQLVTNVATAVTNAPAEAAP
jgi:hypothetical protein